MEARYWRAFVVLVHVRESLEPLGGAGVHRAERLWDWRNDPRIGDGPGCNPGRCRTQEEGLAVRGVTRGRRRGRRERMLLDGRRSCARRHRHRSRH
jgi:hypothetical protein